MFKKIVCRLGASGGKRRCSSVCNWSTPVVPATKISVLSNGVRVATEQSAQPLVCQALMVEAGPRFETAFNNGLTHFIEHLAFKGFQHLDKNALEESLLYNGAKATVTTTREIQTFSGTCPQEFASTLLDYLLSIPTNLALSEQEVEKERGHICLELVDAEKDPKAVLFDYLHSTAFQGTPLGQRVIGSTQNVSKFDRNYAKQFLLDHYQPWRFVVAASGDVCHENVVAQVERRLGELAPTVCAPDWSPCRYTGSQAMFRDDSMPLCHVAVAFEAPGFASPDWLPMRVASQIIGSWDRSAQLGHCNAYPLASKVSLGNLAERYESFYISYRDIGLWGIYFVSGRMQIEDMLYNVQNAWMNLCTTLQFSDLERGVRSLKRQLAADVVGSVRSCRDIGKQLLYLCERKTLPVLYEELSRVKVFRVQEVADRHLYDRCPAVASVGPSENLPEYNRIRSGQYWLRL